MFKTKWKSVTVRTLGQKRARTLSRQGAFVKKVKYAIFSNRYRKNLALGLVGKRARTLISCYVYRV